MHIGIDLQNRADSIYTHCRILDINGDGVKDLLLSGDGENTGKF